MTEEELKSLDAIRERLRAIEKRLDEYERFAASRADKIDQDLRELAKTTARLSEIVATIAARTGSAGLPSSLSGGAAGGSLALAVYYLIAAMKG